MLVFYLIITIIVFIFSILIINNKISINFQHFNYFLSLNRPTKFFKMLWNWLHENVKLRTNYFMNELKGEKILLFFRKCHAIHTLMTQPQPVIDPSSVLAVFWRWWTKVKFKVPVSENFGRFFYSCLVSVPGKYWIKAKSEAV